MKNFERSAQSARLGPAGDVPLEGKTITWAIKSMDWCLPIFQYRHLVEKRWFARSLSISSAIRSNSIQNKLRGKKLRTSMLALAFVFMLANLYRERSTRAPSIN